jgi:hypothetical protein
LERITRSVGIAALAVSVLVVVGPAVASASTRVAEAQPRIVPAVLELGGGSANVKTSNGTSFMLVVGWSDLVSRGGTADLSVGLQRLVKTGGTGYELHLWDFSVAKSTLSFNKKTGTLKASASPVASVSLSFKTTSSKKATCTSGAETIYSGTLSGTVTLATGLSGGGTVKGSSFTAGKPEITVDSGCVPPALDLCEPSLLASSGNFGTSSPTAFAGSFSDVGPTVNVVGLELLTELKSPSGATRTDVSAMIDKAGKVYAILTSGEVKMASSGFVSGSATVSKGTPFSHASACKWDKKSYTLTLHVDEPASYAGSLSGHNAIGGVMKSPASTTTGLYEVTTVTP